VRVDLKAKVCKALGYDYSEDRDWIFPGESVVLLNVQAERAQVDNLATDDPESMAWLGRQVALALKHDLIVQRVQDAYPGEEGLKMTESTFQLEDTIGPTEALD
jgi:hypothetical protein